METPGVKARLFKLLAPITDPITAEDLWPLASVQDPRTALLNVLPKFCSSNRSQLLNVASPARSFLVS